MLRSKIIEVPIANGSVYAEEVVNAELAKINGTISSVTHLDERRVMIIFEGEDSSESSSNVKSSQTPPDVNVQ